MEGVFRILFCKCAIVFADNSLFTNFSLRKVSTVSLRLLEFVGSASLEEALLVAKEEFFVGFSFFFD